MSEPKFEIKKLISMNVDVRKSTTFHERVGNLEKSSKIMSDFIREVYNEVRKENKNYIDNCIYAGDGIIFIIFPNENDKDLSDYKKVVKVSFKIKKIIKNYVNKYSKYQFSAGIGIDSGKSGRQAVLDVQEKFNNYLYTGKPVSFSTKLCGSMPLDNQHYLEPRYIAISEIFYNHLQDEEKSLFKLTNSKKKAVENNG